MEHNKYGQAIGNKGAASRRRLLDAGRALLDRGPTRTLCTRNIAKAAGMASQSFYAYFSDLDEWLAVLARETVGEAKAVFKTLEGDWDEGPVEIRLRRFVEAFLAYWQKNQALFALLNFRADSGDEQFTSIRNDMAAPIVQHIAGRMRMVAGEARLAENEAITRGVLLYAGLDRLAARIRNGRIGSSDITVAEMLDAEVAVLAALLRRPDVGGV